MEVLPYEYVPLQQPKQIRVLEVQRTDHEDEPLRAKLHHVDLKDDDRLSYIAFSYTWGEKTSEEPLFVEGCRLTLQHNLATALRSSRANSSHEYIWADAVCIDQQNNEEKSWQIPLMGQIYREALQVRVWLGDAPEHIARLIGIRGALRSTVPADSGWHKKEIGPLMFQLGHLPWFSRRWIIQEVAVNPMVTLICGHVEISCALLVNESWDDHNNPDPERFEILMDLWRTMHNFRPEDGFENRNRGILGLLSKFDTSLCADDRDPLSALLGLANLGPYGFHINYSLSVEQNYINFAEELCRRTYSVGTVFEEALSRRGADDAESGRLPSWVPDWRNHHKSRVIGSIKQKGVLFDSDAQVLRRSQTGQSFLLTTTLYSFHREDTAQKVSRWSRLSRRMKRRAHSEATVLTAQKARKPSLAPFKLTWTSDVLGPIQNVEDLATWILKVAESLCTADIWTISGRQEIRDSQLTWNRLFEEIYHAVDMSVYYHFSPPHGVLPDGPGRVRREFFVPGVKIDSKPTIKTIARSLLFKMDGDVLEDPLDFFHHIHAKRLIACKREDNTENRIVYLGLGSQEVLPNDEIHFLKINHNVAFPMPRDDDFVSELSMQRHFVFRNHPAVPREQYAEEPEPQHDLPAYRLVGIAMLIPRWKVFERAPDADPSDIFGGIWDTNTHKLRAQTVSFILF